MYQEGKELEWKKQLATMLAPHAPSKPIVGPTRAVIEYVWPLRKGDVSTKAKIETIKRERWKWHPQKPDCDNAVKTLFDVLQDTGYLADDKCVVEMLVRKTRGLKPGIYIELREAWPRPLLNINGDDVLVVTL